MGQKLIDNIDRILKEELITAFGCTEPIAIAYACAVSKEHLGAFPDKMTVYASKNIIKNVKSVVVPNSGGLKGIGASALMGLVAGDPTKKLDVIQNVTDDQKNKVKELLGKGFCSVFPCKSKSSLKIVIKLEKGDEYVRLTILHVHTNITKIEKNGKIIYSHKTAKLNKSTSTDRACLELENILEYIKRDDISEDILNLADKQAKLNMEIAKEGLKNDYGMKIGKTLFEMYDDIFSRARATAAAGSDARMSGCKKPVVINSGSGNQGITASVPVIYFAQKKKINGQKLKRALILSNLVSIMIKSKMSRLSAFCGAVSASCGAGAALTYLEGGSEKMISDTIINVLGNVSGIVCDGAKPSCAAKIASSLDAAFFAHTLALKGLAFHGGDGIIKDTINDTINAVCRMEGKGMKRTDTVIVDIMTQN